MERPYVQPGSARAARTVSTSGTVRMECAVKIISGGQAGADRAALDFAIKHNMLMVGGAEREKDGGSPH